MSYGKYENYFDKNEQCEKLRNADGYVNLKTNWIHHMLIAAGGYLLMNVLSIIFVVIIQSMYQAKGWDFACIKQDLSHDSCPVGVFETYITISTISQLVAELLVVAIVMFLFKNKIKELINQIKDNKTWKWVGIGFILMYAGNLVYSTILQLFDVKMATNANQSAVNQIIMNLPFLGFMFVVVAAPLFEEIIFRFGVFRCFTNKGKKMEIIGLIVTTVLFAGIHLSSTFEQALSDPSNINWGLIQNDMLSLPVYLIGAFFLTFSYFKSKNFFTPIALHMAWNFLSYLANLIQLPN